MADIKHRKKKKKHKRRSKERRILIGGFLSILLIIYLIGSGLKLTRKTPLSIEAVQMGTIDNNIHLKGVLIRNETVLKSKKEGNIQYLVYEGEKVKTGQPVCMIANNSTVSKLQESLDKINEDIIKVQNQRKEFSLVQKEVQNINYQIYDLVDKLRSTYSNKNYIQLYSLKNSIITEIDKKKLLLSQENSSSLKNLVLQKNDYEDQISENSDIIAASIGGIVSYYIDGLEEQLNPEKVGQLSQNDLENVTESKDVSQVSVVKKATPLFKIVDNYDWYLAGIISSELTQDWTVNDEVSIRMSEEESTVVKMRIHSIKPLEKDAILVLRSTEQILPFISKRNVEFEIIRDDFEGIKIPINSIAEKIFLKIPKNYTQQSGKQTVVIKKGIEEDKLIAVEPSFEDEESVYILQDLFSINLYDTLILPEDPEKEFVIEESQSKIGVFVVNGGIIRFKQIEILIENNDYAVVNPNTAGGIRLYDQIVSNAKNARENQLLNQFHITENN